MRAPAFWWRDGPCLRARLLSPLGAAYGAATARRMAQTGESAGVPVICIGNPTAGGAGKTPVAIAIAGRLAAGNARPAMVTRGYGGRLAGPVRVDVQRHGPGEVGDEPLLLARTVATYVSRDRAAGARLAVSDGAGSIVLDDGFQNPALCKDLSLLVVDGVVGAGNGLCLPAGPLRAPLDLQLDRCDGLVVMGDGAPGRAMAARARAMGKPVFTARLEPDPDVSRRLWGRAVVAFAGIGRPEKFASTLRAMGADVVHLVALGDHRAPTGTQARAILERARHHDALIAMTEKDAVKLTGDADLKALRAAAVAVPVRTVFDDADALDEVLRPLITRASAQARSGVS